jgi:hypothetical protein
MTFTEHEQQRSAVAASLLSVHHPDVYPRRAPLSETARSFVRDARELGVLEAVHGRLIDAAQR